MSGRPYHSLDFSLTDQPVPVGIGDADLRGRLRSLEQLDQTIHRLAGDASGLDLNATWLRLESVDDDIDEALAAVRAELVRRGAVSTAPVVRWIRRDPARPPRRRMWSARQPVRSGHV